MVKSVEKRALSRFIGFRQYHWVAREGNTFWRYEPLSGYDYEGMVTDLMGLSD